MQTIAGRFINFSVRLNGSGAAFKQVVCAEDTQFPIDSEVSTRRTNCGPITNVSEPTFSASGNAVHNLNPTSSEVSFNDVKEWIKSSAKLDFRYYNEADAANGIAEGEAVDITGSGYFSNVTYDASAEADGFGGFSFTFTGTGTLDEYDTDS